MTSTSRPVVLVGNLERHLADIVARSASAASLLVECVETAEEARARFEDIEPLVVLVPMADGHAESVCLTVRSDPRLSLVPIIALAQEVTDLVFADIYGFGGDDAVNVHSQDSLTRRLRALPCDLSHDMPAPRGKVVVADVDDRRRLLMARVLRNAGFDVCYALNGAELVELCSSQEAVLVSVRSDLEPGGVVAALRAARKAGSTAPWVIHAPPRELGKLIAATADIQSVMVADGFAPLENMMFIANDTLRGSYGEKRATPRLLFGTSVVFRGAGQDRDEHGFSYNISGDGLYVRTLAPMGSGSEAWVELKPPRTERRVRLEAKVVWARKFGPVQGATVPPGFGLQITGGSQGDLKRFRDGYDAFARDLASLRSSLAPSREP